MAERPRKFIPEKWREAYMHDVVVKAFIDTWFKGSATWAEVMEGLAEHQTKRANAFFSELVRMHEREEPSR